MPTLLSPNASAKQEAAAAQISALANMVAERKAKANVRSRVAEARRMESTIAGFGGQARRGYEDAGFVRAHLRSLPASMHR